MVVDISNYKDLNYYKGKKTILIPDAVDRKNKKYKRILRLLLPRLPQLLS